MEHGVASATVAARFGMECVVYMGAEDIVRQAPNVYRMKLLGAKVVAVESGSKTLKDALNEAMRDVSARGPETPWVFIDTPEYADGFQLSGRYSVDSTTGEIVVKTYLLKGNEVVGSETVLGTSEQMESLIDKLIAVAEEML